jgi:hypothetical protein
MPLMMGANEMAASKDVDASSEMSFASKSSYIRLEFFNNVGILFVPAKDFIIKKSVTSAGGSKRKQKKPKNLTGKNIKEGSAFEEDYLIEVLKDLKLSREQFGLKFLRIIFI